MFQWNPFYQYSDESVDERNRLLLPTVCHKMRKNLDFRFKVSKPLKMSLVKACIHVLKKLCFSLYIMFSMILQLVGSGKLFIGTELAEESHLVNNIFEKGKFDFWYQ